MKKKCLVSVEYLVQQVNCETGHLPCRKENYFITWHENRMGVLELAETLRGGADAVMHEEVSRLHKPMKHQQLPIQSILFTTCYK